MNNSTKNKTSKETDLILTDKDWEDIVLTSELFNISAYSASKIVCDRLRLPHMPVDTHNTLRFFSVRIQQARKRLDKATTNR